MQTYHLSRWYITRRQPHPHSLPFPALGGFRDDGFQIISSRILGKDPENRIITENSLYVLGEPADYYLAQFPNALQRLLASLPLIEKA